MNLRLKFSRFGPVKYLGHLDMMRYFQKAIMRAEIDMKYSEGFNPHQIMSFAYPLGVSMETEGDYMDIEVNSIESLDAIKESLNNVMNEGIKIVSVSEVPDGQLNAMASVAAASYVIDYEGQVYNRLLDEFLSQDTIIVKKEGKKGPIFKDIKEGIFSVELLPDNKMKLFLQSGSSLNIKPSDVIDAYSSYTGDKVKILSICRIEIYRLNSNEKLVPLGDFNE